MAENPEAIVYQVIGREGFEKMAAGFYRRVLTDDILGPMYPKEDMQGAEERLRDFLIYRFGGPAHYIEQRGHPRLRMRHAPFRIDSAGRDRWVQLMTESMHEANIPAEPAAILLNFFQNTATFMINSENGQSGAGFAGNPHFPVRE